MGEGKVYRRKEGRKDLCSREQELHEWGERDAIPGKGRKIKQEVYGGGKK